MKNIIFLDIDGVLNMYGSSYRTFMKPFGQHIELHLVHRLNYIVEQVEEISFVISSSWRFDMKELKKQLEQQGFKYWDKVIGSTASLDFRGQEIKAWILSNKFKGKYLVIDDEIIDICGEKCDLIPKNKVLQTDGNEGLLHKNAIFAINYFKGKE